MAKSIRIGPGVYVRVRPNGSWQARFHDPRRSPPDKAISLRTDDLDTAIDKAHDLKKRWQRGEYDPWTQSAVSTVTKGSALARFKSEMTGFSRPGTIKDYVWVFEKATESIADSEPLSNVTTDMLRSFVQRESLSQSSRSSYFRKLHVFLGWAVTAGLIKDNPLDTVRRPTQSKPLPNAMTEDEFAKVVARGEEIAMENYHNQKNPYWFVRAWEVIATTGLRPSEAARLTWDCVFFPDSGIPGTVLVRSRGRVRSKTDKERVVTMSIDALEVLSSLADSASTNWVLTNHTDKRPINVDRLSKRFRHIREEVGLPESYNLYSLRHFFGAQYVRRGGSVRMLQGEYGHASVQTTQGYAVFGADERVRYSENLHAEHYRKTGGK